MIFLVFLEYCEALSSSCLETRHIYSPVLNIGLGFLLDAGSVFSGEGLVCLLEFSVFFCVAAGVFTGDGLGLIVEVYSLTGEALMGAFFNVVIFVGDGDLGTGGGVIMCLADGEDGTEELVPYFFSFVYFN